MAYENVTETIPGVVAAADLSAKQHTFVLIDTNGKVAANTVSGGPVVGVLQDKPNADGKAASVGVAGVTKLVAGGTVASGAKVMSHTDGTGILCTAGLFFAGIVLIGADAGEVMTVQLGINGYLAV